MNAMILAAGRGERMRPLTDRTPKPLLKAGGKPLIEHHLLALKAAGVDNIVVNSAHLGEQVRAFLGDGSRWGLRIVHSIEPTGALETGGGILNALGHLGRNPFLLINGDVCSDLDFSSLPEQPEGLAHLVLVPNPPHHERGDFGLHDGRVTIEGTRHTYAGIAVIRPELVEGHGPGRFPLAPLLAQAIRAGRVSGQMHRGLWLDVGTVARLGEADRMLAEAN